MFFFRRGEWMAEVTCPAGRPSCRTAHLVSLNSMGGPSISIPAIFRRTPSALRRIKEEGVRRKTAGIEIDRKSTRLYSSHSQNSYSDFCLSIRQQSLQYMLSHI